MNNALSVDFEGRVPVTSSRIALGHAIAAAQHTGQTFPGIIARFHELGLEVHPMPASTVQPEAIDLVLLSENLNGTSPWLDVNWIEDDHILRAALHTGRSVGEVRRRLSILGYQVPAAKSDQNRFTEADALILRAEHNGALQTRPVALGFLHFAAEVTGLTVEVVSDRLRRMGLPVARSLQLQPESTTKGLESIERWSGRRRFHRTRWPIPRREIFLSAKEKSLPPGEVAEVLERMGLVTPHLRDGCDTTWRTLSNIELSELRNMMLDRSVPLTHVLGTALSLGRSPSDVAGLLTSLGIPCPAPGELVLSTDDAILISMNLDGKAPWLYSGGDDDLFVAHVLAAAVQLRRKPSELADRIRSLGVPVADPDGWAACPISSSTALLLTEDIDLEEIISDDGIVSAVHVLRASGITGRRPLDIADELRYIGFGVESVTGLVLTHDDDLMLQTLLGVPRMRTGRAVSYTELGRAAVLATAYIRGRDPAEVARRAEALGIRLSMSFEAFGRIDVRGDDLLLLSYGLDASAPWLPNWPVSVGHILAAAGRTGRRVSEIVERFRELGFPVEEIPPPDLEVIDAVDVVLLSQKIDGTGPWLENRVIPRVHLLRAACAIGCDMAEVADRFQRLGFVLPAQRREIDQEERNHLTVALYGVDTTDHRSDRITAAQALGVAEYLGHAPSDVAAVLTGLGLTVELTEDMGTMSAGSIDSLDVILLSANLDGEGPWIDGEVCLAHVVAAAGYLRVKPSYIVTRLRQVGFETPDLVESAENSFIDGIDAALVEFLHVDDVGYSDRPYSRAEILTASYRFRWTPTRIADRLIELGFSVPCRDSLAEL